MSRLTRSLSPLHTQIDEQKEKKVYDGFKLAIGDTRGFTEYKNGGVLTQVGVSVAPVVTVCSLNIP